MSWPSPPSASSRTSWWASGVPRRSSPHRTASSGDAASPVLPMRHSCPFEVNVGQTHDNALAFLLSYCHLDLLLSWPALEHARDCSCLTLRPFTMRDGPAQARSSSQSGCIRAASQLQPFILDCPGLRTGLSKACRLHDRRNNQPQTSAAKRLSKPTTGLVQQLPWRNDADIPDERSC